MPDFKTEQQFDVAPATEVLADGELQPNTELLETEGRELSPAEQRFAARVALYGPELAPAVTEFYDKSLVNMFKTKLGHIADPVERNQRAHELAEATAERMDLSRGRGYIQHPAHAALPPKTYK